MRVMLALFCLLCSQAAVWAQAVPETQSNQKKKRPATQQVVSGTPEQQAMALVSTFWRQRYSQCGTDWLTSVYLVGPDGSKLRLLGVMQFKNFTWDLQPHALSEADRLNGIEWGGYSLITFTSMRWRPEGSPWQPWVSDGSYTVVQRGLADALASQPFRPRGDADNYTAITRQSGRWIVSPLSTETREPIACSSVPQ
jgi:hypothetical protein